MGWLDNWFILCLLLERLHRYETPKCEYILTMHHAYHLITPLKPCYGREIVANIALCHILKDLHDRRK
jgi:hypothetical protein